MGSADKESPVITGEKDILTGKKKKLWAMLLCVIGILINLSGGGIAQAFKLPVFLDTIGTVLTAVTGGYLPGIVVGLATNLIRVFFDPTTIYYGFLNVFIAVCSAFLAQKHFLKKVHTSLLFILILSLIGGGLGSLLTWFLYGFAGEGISVPFVLQLYKSGIFSQFQAQMTADFLIDLADKVITVVLVLLVMKLLPEGFADRFQVEGWQQAPLTAKNKEAARRAGCRVISLRTKVLLVLTVAALLIAMASTGISYMIYRQNTVEEHTKFAKGVANLASSVIDPEMVNDFMTQGESAEGYKETEKLLYGVRESSPDISYVYVYKIMEDGCHVVFDLDTEESTGSEPGEVVEFDKSFEPYLQDLLEGRPIDPIISDDSYGWLLTVYVPVYDSKGVCQCYAAADVSMDQLRAASYSFFAQLISLFLGVFVLILFVGLWLAEYNVILPVNTMALSASAFAYNSDEARIGSVDRIRELDIHTGDEIENLYKAFVKTTEDSMQYVDDIQNKTETISQMQNGLIMVLADMVESRDKCTGDHVRKTAAYTKIIMKQMREMGIYPEELTDEFISDVGNSAPLHDVGKIHVSDVVLNKPAKLTDEEFEVMKTHTTMGKEIIDQAIAIVPESGYLAEAKNLATYHHEKWNGTGYPEGLSGEEIPLSARIMAVADVFDALVSKRSYKKAFSFEKAMDIIKEGAGSHFDPKVVEAFVSAEDEVRRVAEELKDKFV